MLRLFCLWIACLLPCAVLPAQDLDLVASSERVSAQTLQRIRELAVVGLADLAPQLSLQTVGRIRIVVHRRRADLSPARQRDLPKGVPGFARLGQNELHLVLDEMEQMPPNDLRTTLRHELVHVLLDQLLGVAGPHIARWFHEGLAQELAEAVYLNMKEEELVPWLLSGNLPSFQSLDRVFPRRAGRNLAVAYAQSQSFFHFLRKRFGLERLLEMARRCREDRRFAEVLLAETGKAQVYWEVRWHRYLREDSGAGWRVLLRNCFSFLVVLALPLLAIAMARRRNRNQRILEAMASQEAEELEAQRQAELRAQAEAEALAAWQSQRLLPPEPAEDPPDDPWER